jgi:FkbM family methyltransferase
MLIKIQELVGRFNMKIKGILHIGAHECEELNDYISVGVNRNKIHWVEGQETIVNTMKQKGVQHIYHGLIDDVNDKEVFFNIANNGQSSSILEFGSHLKHHPHVQYISKSLCKTIRLDTLIEREKIPMNELNFLNLDIQGVELRALKSMEKYLNHIDYIYTEVNTEEVYKDCANLHEIDNYLKQFGFIRRDARIYKEFGWGDAIYIKEN